ncbi:O-antigen ligase family protein [Sneathiella aquimaris]|uniref:O-antigen ligase family protein n=1 Tax=Sneathiella aquimaris TaxID=2599305 RepID=UPI00146CBC11|nr:O-antigen ligase family protein [Sneathiella aquimaris]
MTQWAENRGMERYLVLTLVILGGLIAFAFAISNPILVSAVLLILAAGIAFVWLSFERPLITLIIVTVAQVLIPPYIRLPIPGLPPVPLALLLMAIFCSMVILKGMLKPARIDIGRDERLLTRTLLLYSGILLFTTAIGTPDLTAIQMWIKTAFIPVLMYLIVVRTINSIDDFQRLLDMLLLSAVACGVLAVHEFVTNTNIVALYFAPEVSPEDDFFLWYLVAGERETLEQPYRVFSFFTQPLEFSAFMIMMMPYAILSFVNQKLLGRRLIYGLSIIIVFAGYVVTFSRGPTLALMITIFVLAVLEKPLRKWVMIGITCLTILSISASPWIIDQKLMDRIQGTENVSLRFQLWQNGLAIFQKNPLFGIGYGAYPSHHVKSIRENKIGPMYEYHWKRIELVTTVENIYVTLAAETGLVGLTAFFVMLLRYFSIIRKILRQTLSVKTRTLALGSLGGVLAYLLSGMTVANIIGYTISIIFFGVFFAAAAILPRSLPDKTRPPARLQPH